eukprot:SAG31_NODE_48263_length_196_cov_44.773196_1_plen_42_part_01
MGTKGGLLWRTWQQAAHGGHGGSMLVLDGLTKLWLGTDEQFW